MGPHRLFWGSDEISDGDVQGTRLGRFEACCQFPSSGVGWGAPLLSRPASLSLCKPPAEEAGGLMFTVHVKGVRGQDYGKNIPDDLFFLCPRAGPGQPQYPHMKRGPHCGVLVLSGLPRPFPPFLEHVLKPCHLALGLPVPQRPSLFPRSLSAASSSSCSQWGYRSWRPAWMTKGLCSLPDAHPSFPAAFPRSGSPPHRHPL